MQYRDNDYGSYDKDTNKTIDICLNCTEIHCTGECKRISGPALTEKEYIIKRIKKTPKGAKISYITFIKETRYCSGTNIWKAKKATKETMNYHAKILKKHLPPNVKLEVIEWREELVRSHKSIDISEREQPRN